MLTLILDNNASRPIHLDATRSPELSFEAPGSDPLAWRGGTLRVAAVIDARNRAYLGDIDSLCSRQRFNALAHPARIEVDGCTIFAGTASLERIEQPNGKERWAHFLIAEPEPAWLTAARRTPLRQTAIALDEVIGPQTIRESWTWDKPVRWLPVQRETLSVDGAASVAIASERVLTAEDYHPFLHIATLLRAIFEQAGYRLESDFVQSEFFRSLYMSGAYPERDTSLLRSRLDFVATRSSDVTATADRLGNVYADPYNTSPNSLGNLADGAPETNIAGVFRAVDRRWAFVPAAEVEVGFEYRLRYRTPYRILSREELSGFNRVHLGSGTDHSFKIINRFEDRRAQLDPGKNYRVVVFDHTPGEAYELCAGQTSIARFAARSASVTLPETPIDSLELRMDGAPCPKDWALYDGYVDESGETTLEVTLRSAPEHITPAAGKYFDTIFIGGGEQGMQLTLLAGSTIRPYLTGAPGVGSRVHFDQVAAHTIHHSDLLEAIAHLFDLRIHTDPLTRTVHLEPAAAFFRPAAIVDWSQRIDRSKPIVYREPGEGLDRLTTYAYRSGDGYVTRYNTQNATRVGEWSAAVESTLARDRERRSENPLFTPTLSRAGDYPQARDAQLMQVGSRADYPAEHHTSLNFPAKIVSYLGLEPLPVGQLWGWPSYIPAYPLAAFHLPGRLTLCFEDRDRIEGLHRYYDPHYRAMGTARRLTCHICLRPADIEAIAVPNPSMRDMRSTFRLIVEGQPLFCRLERIDHYDPTSPDSTRCTFITQ